jgi:hypothetical protein
MTSLKVPVHAGYTVLLLFSLLTGFAYGQSSTTAPAPKFELKDGDRIVFLGNSIFENDFQYGYLELALTTRYAEKGITFRNLGWTGDNVWGEGRSTYTNPPTPYQHLMQDITNAKPTVVFLGYGGVEAQDGKAGVPKFKEGLNKLIDKIDSLGAKVILLSTIPVVSGDTTLRIDERNADLELYATAIYQVASQRSKPYIDIYNPILNTSKKADIIENTVHLNETGYYYLATVLEKALGLENRQETTSLNLIKGQEQAVNARLLGGDKGNAVARFAIDDKYLPLPSPKSGSWLIDNARVIKIAGLKKGYYVLKSDNQEVVAASAKEWASGVEVRQGPAFTRSQEVRNMIIKKNELHFFQYRPLNQTYIIGFRKYEQGRHVKGLEEQNILIKWLEGQIILNSEPREVVYELIKLD